MAAITEAAATTDGTARTASMRAITAAIARRMTSTEMARTTVGITRTTKRYTAQYVTGGFLLRQGAFRFCVQSSSGSVELFVREPFVFFLMGAWSFSTTLSSELWTS